MARVGGRRALWGLLLFVSVFLVSPPSFASAPMCGDLGETIAAPPPILPHDDGSIEPWAGCPDIGESSELRISRPHGEPPAVEVAPAEHALAAFSYRVPKCVGSFEVRTPMEARRVRLGPVGTVYRPPRISAFATAGVGISVPAASTAG